MGNNFNMRTLFLVFVAIMLVQGFLTWNSEELFATLMTLPGLILGLTVHEYAHARTSDKLRRSHT